ncbi:putative curli production protein [Escherichia coli]|uniref:Curli assembly protein CsgC n=1 Tax=Escherichia coli TaxID=562 RepID=A0A377CY44_ECOLX|nr:putative curli production protein [Escherichia coli]
MPEDIYSGEEYECVITPCGTFQSDNFNTTQQGDMYTIIPEVTLLNLVCAEYKYCPCAKAVQGKVRRSKKRPSHCLLITHCFDEVELNISPDDRVKIVVMFLMDSHFIYHKMAALQKKS